MVSTSVIAVIPEMRNCENCTPSASVLQQFCADEVLLQELPIRSDTRALGGIVAAFAVADGSRMARIQSGFWQRQLAWLRYCEASKSVMLTPSIRCRLMKTSLAASVPPVVPVVPPVPNCARTGVWPPREAVRNASRAPTSGARLTVGGRG